jgi:protein-S-isoprenylcysteine O-methyltransferase Ste14
MKMHRFRHFFGVGPRGAFISIFLFWLAFKVDIILGSPKILANPSPVKILGGVLAILGICLLLWSSWTLRKWWSSNQLCTNGPFKWFRHPIYAAWISFLLPALAFYLNSWVVFFTVGIVHLVWHRLVISEEQMMNDNFHNIYSTYASRTGRFFPRLWKH